MFEITMEMAMVGWAFTGFAGGFAFAAWRRKVCLLIFVVSVILGGLCWGSAFASVIINGCFDYLWGALTAFGVANPFSLGVATIAGMKIGELMMNK